MPAASGSGKGLARASPRVRDRRGDAVPRPVSVAGSRAVPGWRAGNEAVLNGVGINLTGFSVSDANTQATSITVTLTDTIGQLSASDIGGGTVTGSGSATLTISGTFAQVNADLTTLAYLASTTGTDTIIVNSVDSLGSKGLQASVPVTVLPIAPPTINVPSGSVLLQQSTTKSITPVSITYPDSAVAGEQVNVMLSDPTGQLAVNTATAGGGGTVTGSGTTSLSISGTLPQVDADLATLRVRQESTARSERLFGLIV